MTDQAISPLRRRMIEDMTIRTFAPKTQQLCVKGQGLRRVFPQSGEIGGRAPLSAASGERQPLKQLKPGASQVIRRGQDAGAASQTLPEFRSTASPRVDVRMHNRRRAIPPAQTRRLGVDQRAKAADLAKQVQSIMIG
jgi:hypothetical protein